MQLLVCKIGTTFLLGWFRHGSPQLMAFVDIQQLILVCNEASDWSTALGTVSTYARKLLFCAFGKSLAYGHLWIRHHSRDMVQDYRKLWMLLCIRPQVGYREMTAVVVTDESLRREVVWSASCVVEEQSFRIYRSDCFEKV